MNKLKSFLLAAVVLVSTLGFAVDVKSTTTTTDPVGNVTTEVFFGPYPFSVTNFKGSGTQLSVVSSCYNNSCTVGAVAVPITEKDVSTLVTGISGASQVKTTYNTYGLPLDTKLYDYGPSLVSEQVTTYCSLGNANIRNRQCDVTTKNGGGTKIAQTTSTFDGNGNMLSAAHLVTGSTFLTEHFTYTGKGIPATSTGVNGAVTTYNNGACSNIEPSSIAFPVTGTQSFVWNCNGAVQTSTTDVNGSTYAAAYGDPFWRPTSGIDSKGTVTALKYTPNTYESIVSYSNSINDNLTTFNVAGKPIATQTRQSQGSGQYDTTSQAYDSIGRRASLSLPCVSSAGAPCGAVQTTAQYDSGSVPTTSISDTLGGTITTTYTAGDKVVLVTPAPSGETTKGKQYEYDGLNRLTSVCELSNGPGSGSCGQRVAGTGYATTYTYDSLGNVTTITQGAQTRTLTYDDLGRVLTSTEPETGTTTYVYDTTGDCGGTTSNGDLVEVTDNAGNIACYKYDSVSRLTSVTYTGPNPTDNIFYVYDSATVNGQSMQNAKGRLAEAYTCTSCPGIKKTDIGFSYDIVGQTTDTYESTINSGGYYHLSLTVYPNQSIHTLQMTPAVIPTISYGLDGEGRASTVLADGVSLVSNTTRIPGDQVQSLTYGSSDVDSFGFDSLKRMTQYSLSAGGNSVVGTLSYNANGTLSGRVTNDPFKAANNETCAYTYDSLVRLATANCGTVNQTFSYDRYGNISKSGTFSFLPTYNSATNRMTAIGAVTPTYDNNGNLLTDGTRTYTWDANGNMLSVSGTTLLYDALGRMVEQASGSTHQQIVYFPSGEKLALMNGQSLNLARVPLPGGAQAVYTSSGLSYYAHVDNLGTTRVTTASDRSLVSNLLYAPFGEPYNNAGVPTSTLNFTGHYQDTISGLYDTPTREYDPLQGRWISSDKGGKPTYNDPQTFNLYAYATNRPFDFVDINGADEDPVYAPGVDPSNGESGYFGNPVDLSIPYNASDAPLVYNADEPAGGAGGSFSKWDGLAGIDPLGLVAGFDVPLDALSFVGQYASYAEAKAALPKKSGSWGNLLRVTNKVLDRYGSLRGSSPQLALGLNNPYMTRAEVKALPFGTHSLLTMWAEDIGAKTWMEFDIDTMGPRQLIGGIHRLMTSVRDAGGLIHFNLEGLQDIPAAVASESRLGIEVETYETDIFGRPKKILVPFNNGVTIEELRHLKTHWEVTSRTSGVAFKDMTIFYREGLPILKEAPGAAPYVPW